MVSGQAPLTLLGTSTVLPSVTQGRGFALPGDREMAKASELGNAIFRQPNNQTLPECLPER